MENLMYWNKFDRPPREALKQITAGRLKGMSDVNPQWRIKAMTEVFGPIGFGWKYDIDKLWTTPSCDNQVIAFAEISLFIKRDDEWSAAIKGVGGSTLVANERNGLHSNDEAYKMAVTDALSVAMKQLGVAADIYFGLWDGSKYKEPEPPALGKQPKPDKPGVSDAILIDDVEEKSGEKNGKPWTMYIIHSGDEKYRTFKQEHASIAMSAAHDKIKCIVDSTQGKYGRKLVSIDPIIKDDIPI